MKTRLLIACLVCVVFQLSAQVPSVQLKIKEKSGFLGMGGPRIVRIDLSNQNHQPITCDNVNGGQYYYFLVAPVGDWVLDADFVNEDLVNVSIYQNQQTIPIGWKSEIIAGGNGSLLLGFPKTVKLNQLFLFQCLMNDAKNQVECKVPQDYWPGYSKLTGSIKEGDASFDGKQYRKAITSYEKIVGDPALQIFPQYDVVKEKRIKTFDTMFADDWNAFQAMAKNSDLLLKEKIGHVDSLKPLFKYVVDSLPRVEWGIGSLDPTIAPILDKAQAAYAQATLVRDSLQHVLDEQNTRWIINGSSTGKNGFLFQYIIETLAYAFSSLPFDDTSMVELKVRIPEEMNARLIKNNILESYQTFLRICNERFRAHMPIFPVDFLPNLRKDTMSFALPYYSMLKAVNDFYYKNYNDANNEILKIFRSCYETELSTRFDAMRIVIVNRNQHISDDVFKMIDEGEQLEAKRDANGAAERYRQITLVAPNFAYGFFIFGKFYLRTGDSNRAIYYFQRAYQVDTLYLTAYRECFNAYLKQGNYKPMIDVLSTALAKGNDYWEINYNLGQAYAGDGDIAQAIQRYERALALNPKTYKTNLQLGLAYQNVKSFQKAREYFNNAIGIDPTRQEAVDYLTKLNELQRSGK